MDHGQTNRQTTASIFQEEKNPPEFIFLFFIHNMSQV